MRTFTAMWLRDRGFDVLDAVAAGLFGATDVQLLRRAFSEDRVVVTHDRDFGTLAVLAGEPLLGIVYTCDRGTSARNSPLKPLTRRSEKGRRCRHPSSWSSSEGMTACECASGSCSWPQTLGLRSHRLFQERFESCRGYFSALALSAALPAPSVAQSPTSASFMPPAR
jgi:hypothetical protein